MNFTKDSIVTIFKWTPEEKVIFAKDIYGFYHTDTFSLPMKSGKLGKFEVLTCTPACEPRLSGKMVQTKIKKIPLWRVVLKG